MVKLLLSQVSYKTWKCFRLIRSISERAEVFLTYVLISLMQKNDDNRYSPFYVLETQHSHLFVLANPFSLDWIKSRNINIFHKLKFIIFCKIIDLALFDMLRLQKVFSMTWSFNVSSTIYDTKSWKMKVLCI